MVKHGYKQTEIGVIPEDWEVRRLRETGTFFSTNSLSRDKLNYNNGTFYNIHYGDIHTQFKSHFNIQNEIVPFINNDIKPSTINLCKKGDLIIADASENEDDIGKAIEIINDGNKNIVAGLHTLHFRPFNDVFYEGFLGHLWKTELMHLNILKEAQGTKVLGISVSRLLDLQIPLPPLAEQEAIASALSDADAWIESLEQLIAKKRLIKQGAMQELLTPPSTGNADGEALEPWEVKKLGDCLNYIQPTPYLVKSTEYNPNNDIPVLTAGKTFILGYTEEDFGVFDKLPTIIFDDFTTASKYVNFPFKAKSSAMKMLVLKNDSNNLKFIYEIMQVLRFQVGDHKRHWIGEFQNLDIKVPSLSDQERIATILSDMDAELEALEQKLSKARQIKQGMMQELLTGRIRL